MGSRTIPLSSARWSVVRPIIVGGEWSGFWAWDPDEGALNWGLMRDADPAVIDAIELRAAATAEFIRNELGGAACTNGIDGAKSRARRLAFVAELPVTGRV